MDVWAIEHVSPVEDSKFIKFMIEKGYYYFDILCIPVADYIFVRKESAVFSKLKVPLLEQNRTRICPYKTYASNPPRDPHHYPNLEFSYEPLKHQIPPGEDMNLDKPHAYTYNATTVIRSINIKS